MGLRTAPHTPLTGIQTVVQAYASGAATPASLLRQTMQRIADYPDKSVWITLLNESQIAAQVTTLEKNKAAGDQLPLYGIPFAVKDNIDVAGVPTTAACPAFSYMPTKAATAVQKLIDAGAIVVGKTNMDQFATGLVGTRSPHGACRNVFDSDFISGGSSSGSAVAVAAGLVPFSLGTDTAGSGRVPAAFGNIVGLKPTLGRVSTAGVVPACRTLDCVSIFATTVEDANTILHLISGPDETDAFSRTSPAAATTLTAKTPFRCGIPSHDFLHFFGNDDAQSLFADAIARIPSLGGATVEIDFAPFAETAQLLYGGGWVAERLTATKNILRENRNALVPVLRTILEKAQALTAEAVFAGFYRLQELKTAAAKQWARMDVLLLPTTGTIYTIKEVLADPITLNTNLGTYTNFVNLMDLSAVAVPNGFQQNGVPLGVTFIAPAWEDSIVFDIAARYHAQVKQEGVA